jgi:hypothetical protein
MDRKIWFSEDKTGAGMSFSTGGHTWNAQARCGCESIINLSEIWCFTLQLNKYRKSCCQMVRFEGTSMLQKAVPTCRIVNQRTSP